VNLEVKSSGLVRKLIGRVVSAKSQKTVTVVVERRVMHQLYGKVVTRSRKYRVHDGDSICAEGDLVEIVACRPVSKTKSWAVALILEKAAI
jgi:small subunit ribosomal protein S17